MSDQEHQSTVRQDLQDTWSGPRLKEVVGALRAAGFGDRLPPLPDFYEEDVQTVATDEPLLEPFQAIDVEVPAVSDSDYAAPGDPWSHTGGQFDYRPLNDIPAFPGLEASDNHDRSGAHLPAKLARRTTYAGDSSFHPSPYTQELTVRGMGWQADSNFSASNLDLNTQGDSMSVQSGNSFCVRQGGKAASTAPRQRRKKQSGTRSIVSEPVRRNAARSSAPSRGGSKRAGDDTQDYTDIFSPDFPFKDWEDWLVQALAKGKSSDYDMTVFEAMLKSMGSAAPTKRRRV